MDLTIQFICENQHEDGGFYYDYAKGNVTNFSNAGFNWQAMKAANVAGCTVSELPNAISKSINHIKTHASATGFYYWTTRPQKRDTSMRALGTLCLQLFGENDDPIVKRMSSFVVNDDYKLMNWQDHGSYERPAAHYLYWMYYATQVAFRSGGKNWTKWNKTFQKLLIENQHPDGYWLSPATRIDIGREMMASIDDKVYSTTLCALQLTVYYRYLPSSKTTQKVQNTHVEEIVDIF
jgi:hypothetical protein